MILRGIQSNYFERENVEKEKKGDEMAIKLEEYNNKNQISKPPSTANRFAFNIFLTINSARRR